MARRRIYRELPPSLHVNYGMSASWLLAQHPTRRAQRVSMMQRVWLAATRKRS
jgi:hypothetical protein